MRIVLGTLELTTIGGVGTYLATAAEQLERMGHEVTIYTEEGGEMASLAAGRGLRVITDSEALPRSVDVVYAQDAPSSYYLADRYRETPQAFCLHATDHDRWLVPQLPGAVSAVVVLHDRALRHAHALSHSPEVVRLRQPVDIRRFSPRGPIAVQPRRALLLGNYVSGNRLELIEDACSRAGIELVRRGLQDEQTTVAPEAEINDADLVIGKSRVIVEALACGRAAYVLDHNGADGWVTAERYPALEADNFDGRADPSARADTFAEDLRGYGQAMGVINRDLAVAHHGAADHCRALVETFARLAPRGEVAGAPLEELRRLTRVQWRADARALGFEHEAKLLRAELQRRNSEASRLQEETSQAQRRAAEAEERAERADRAGAQLRTAISRLEAEVAAFSPSHRALSALSRSFASLRRSLRASR